MPSRFIHTIANDFYSFSYWKKKRKYIYTNTHTHTHTHTCICIYTYIYDIIFTPSAIYWWTLKLFLYLGYCEYMICSSLSLDDAPFISSTALSCVCAQSLSHVLFCNIMDCSPPGLSVHGIFQARILEQVAISSSRGASQPRDGIQVSCSSCIGGQILYHWATWEAFIWVMCLLKCQVQYTLLSEESPCLYDVTQFQRYKNGAGEVNVHFQIN